MFIENVIFGISDKISNNQHYNTLSQIQLTPFICEQLARLYGTSVQEAADIIGNQLDCAPHEDISGYIFMVPNWHINDSTTMAM